MSRNTISNKKKSSKFLSKFVSDESFAELFTTFNLIKTKSSFKNDINGYCVKKARDKSKPKAEISVNNKTIKSNLANILDKRPQTSLNVLSFLGKEKNNGKEGPNKVELMRENLNSFIKRKDTSKTCNSSSLSILNGKNNESYVTKGTKEENTYIKKEFSFKRLQNPEEAAGKAGIYYEKDLYQSNDNRRGYIGFDAISEIKVESGVKRDQYNEPNTHITRDSRNSSSEFVRRLNKSWDKLNKQSNHDSSYCSSVVTQSVLFTNNDGIEKGRNSRNSNKAQTFWVDDYNTIAMISSLKKKHTFIPKSSSVSKIKMLKNHKISPSKLRIAKIEIPNFAEKVKKMLINVEYINANLESLEKPKSKK